MKYNKYFLVYIWSFIILFLIGMPMEEYQGDVFTYYDKVAHAFLFGIFAFLLFNAKYNGKSKKIKKSLYQSFFASLIFAGLGEILQSIVPGRTESLLDFLAGLIGAGFFLILSFYVSTRKK